jgi:hypothetical protein
MAEKPFLLTRAAIAQIQQVVREYNNRNYKNLNEPLKRGRWVGRYIRGTINLQYGIVNADETRGYYTIEIAEWAGTTPIEGEVPDFCGQATGSSSGSGDDSCADILLPEFESQLTGTGVYVLAYDPESVLVPLEIGSDCILADLGSENAMESSTEPVFQILRGYQTHTTEYKERWECCGGVDTLVARTAITFAAKVCQEAICDPCVDEESY